MTKKAFDFGELRSVLQQAPSAAAWDKLCALVMPTRWESASEVWLPYAQAHLDRDWPDDLRVLPAAALKRKQRPSLLKLIRAVQQTAVYATEWRALLDMLDAVQPPLTHLSVWSGMPPMRPDAARLAAHVGRLTSLYSYLSGDSGALIEALRAGGVQAALTTLGFESQAHDSFAPLRALLAEAPALRDVSLRLPNAQPLRAIIDLLPAAQLEALSIQRTSLSPSIAAHLTAHAWPKLHTLDLRGTQIGPRALERLYASTPALRYLYAATSSMSGASLEPLRHAPWALEALSLHEATWIEPGSIASALGARCADGLRELDLGGVQLHASAVEVIARGPMSATLERLDLSQVRVVGDPWGPLAGATMPRLHTLDLSHVTSTDALIAALLTLEAPALSALILPTRGAQHVQEALADTALARFLDAPRAPSAPSRERRLTLPPDHHPLHPNA